MKKLFFSLSLLILLSFTSTSAQNVSYTGWAHYYSDHFQGRTTAYGEPYDRFQFTCANLKFPLNTLLKVTRLDNGKSVVVRVNDKGPFTKPDADGTEYIIDLSLAAANAIDLTVVGEAMVRIDAIGFSTTNPSPDGQSSAAPSTYGGGFTPKGNTNKQVQNYDGSNFPGNYQQVKTIQPGIDGYGIQVGSYTDRQNAERQVQSLQKMGVQHLYLMSKTNPNGQFVHQLIIAKFDTQDQAEQYQVQVENQYLLKGFVKKL
jgi:rare lipoprotein A